METRYGGFDRDRLWRNKVIGAALPYLSGAIVKCDP